jgi:glycosyltransferase involved in cell wall biosynthesis
VGLVLYKPVIDNLRHIGSATKKLWEYAASALPAVATDGDTFREVVGGEPWAAFADPGDPTSIARAVNGLLEDPDRYATLAAAARRAFEERFHFEAAFAPLLAKVRELSGDA